MGATEIISRWTVKTKYEELPEASIRIAKERFIDSVAVALAGSVEPAGAGKKTVELVKELGGKPVSTIIGGGFKSSSPNAALANGTSGHTLDYDDTTTMPLCHYNAALVPGILALAEETGASGKAILEAYVIGYEVGTNIGGGMTGKQYFEKGFHPPSTWATLGITATCGKLLGLTSDQHRHALGIAASACCGIRKNYGTNTKPLHCGYSARNGMIAAMLARKGFTANMDVLDQAPGATPESQLYFSFPLIFAGEGNFDLNKMTDKLGKNWQILLPKIHTKFSPGGMPPAALAELLFSLMKKHKIKKEQIASLEGGVTGAAIGTYPFTDPQCGDEAGYSLNYALAAAWLDGQWLIEQRREERVHSQDVREAMKKVRIYEIKGIESNIRETGDISRIGVVRLTIKTKDGQKYEGELIKAKGHSELPLKPEDLAEKYSYCGAKVLKDDKIERSLIIMQNLEKARNVSELMGLLGG